MFNLQGSELIIILLLALVVLGPEKLPDAMRKLGNFYAQMKKMSTSFQQEFRAAVDEPMREVRETANMLRDSADFRKLSEGERAEKPKTAEMAPATPASTNGTVTPAVDLPAEAPIIPAPKPPAGPVVVGAPPMAAASPAPPPPPPPPPPAPGAAAVPPAGASLPPLDGEASEAGRE